MRLKKMELYGFKSFAQKTLIEFGQGITAVVGPNGSGKSNVADAIRWALGEQSARQLRGSKMEDVIFNGSNNKKALGLAEVSLFFENNDGALAVDYNEVVITRRMYRSGESEYRLNNISCRLRDIYELFMGTGIGKETYATIEQGKIDNLTSTRADERRQVFEEAAGILKHKYKKKEALHKLSDVEQKILRLEDILQEIKQQLEPLLQQKEKAEKFKVYRAVLQESEKKLALNNWHNLEKEKKDLDAAELGNKYKKEALQDEIERATIFLSEVENKIQQREESLTLNLLELKDYESKLIFCQQKMDNAAKQMEELHLKEKDSLQRKDEIAVKLEKEQQEKTIYQNDLKELKEKVYKDQKELENLTAKIQAQEIVVQEKGNEIENLKGDLIDLLNQKAKKEYELKQLAGQEEINLKNYDLIREKEKKLNQELMVVIEKSNELSSESEELTLQKDDFLQKKQYLFDETVLLKNKLLEGQKRWQEREKILNQEKSRKRILGELEQSLDGYYKGTKTILKSDLQACFLGTVAQLITVDKYYEIAIEIALGSSLQHIITPTHQDAQKLITHLKSVNGGRATFLPLDRVHGEKKQIAKMAGLLGIAADLVSFDHTYSGVINQLLGRVLISDNLKHAIEIAAKTGQKYKIITLDGDVVSPGGAMTGGSLAGKQSGLLSRKRELNDLTSKIIALQETQNKEQNLLMEMQKQEENLEQEKVTVRDSLVRLEFMQKQLIHDLSEFDERKKQLAKEQDFLKWQNVQAKKDSENRKQEEAKEKLRFNEILKAEKIKRDLIEECQIADKDLRKELEKINESYLSLKLAITSGENEQKHLLSLLERTEKTIEDIQQELIRCSEQKKEESKKLEQLNLICHTGEQESIILIAKQEENKAKRVILEKEKIDLSNKLQLLKKQLLEKEAIKLELQKNLLHLTSQQAKQEEKLKQQEIWLRENCAKPYPVLSLSDEECLEIANKVTLYSQKMTELGEVNLGAIEEGTKLQERHDFLAVQYADLKKARESLDTLLQELDEIMKKNFLETFALIKDVFQKIFARLFDGGQAQIFLSEAEAVLTSGVEIMVQPPGKKLQALSLLSGGEKSLTAVALLLAILEVKPSPFCLLDEIDAALDDKNVQRVAEVLKEMADLVQFIIITHRKGAMEVADALYGMTMEKGISKLLSVKLESYGGEEKDVQ